jgi:hypothetical protein
MKENIPSFKRTSNETFLKRRSKGATDTSNAKLKRIASGKLHDVLSM